MSNACKEREDQLQKMERSMEEVIAKATAAAATASSNAETASAEVAAQFAATVAEVTAKAEQVQTDAKQQIDELERKVRSLLGTDAQRASREAELEELVQEQEQKVSALDTSLEQMKTKARAIVHAKDAERQEALRILGDEHRETVEEISMRCKAETSALQDAEGAAAARENKALALADEAAQALEEKEMDLQKLHVESLAHKARAEGLEEIFKSRSTSYERELLGHR
ncbi:unnamed protein product, partial [Choristocarpus tenellus]